MAVDIETIKRLNAQTGIGLTGAKKALIEADGDYDKAYEALRIKGLAKADKKSERTASAGLVHSYVHGGKIGVLIELNCETDFVARTDDFKALAQDLVLHIAAAAPSYLTVEDIPHDVLFKERDLFAAELQQSGKPESMIDQIVEGKLEKYYTEVCLMRQGFIKDQELPIEELIKTTIAKLGENIVLRRFARIELGEVI
jgi:elongation factor Ts